MDRIRTENIKDRLNISHSLTDTIERKHLLWYGYMKRMRKKDSQNKYGPGHQRDQKIEVDPERNGTKE